MAFLSFFFFFNDTATTEIYTLSLHDALPIHGQLRKEVVEGDGECEMQAVNGEGVHELNMVARRDAGGGPFRRQAKKAASRDSPVPSASVCILLHHRRIVRRAKIHEDRDGWPHCWNSSLMVGLRCSGCYRLREARRACHQD